MKRKQWHFSQTADGKPWWATPYELCCDCGLGHRVKYEAFHGNKRIKGARIRVTAWRSKGATKEARRLLKKKNGGRLPAADM